MKKIFLLFLLMPLFSLSSCVHKMDVEQGNIITPENVGKLRKGMSESEVKNVMGTPMLSNTFDDNRIDYVYTFKPAYGKTIEKNITLTFKNHRLMEIAGNRYSQYMATA